MIDTTSSTVDRNFAYRRCIRDDQGTTRRHRIQQGPGYNEGPGQINVNIGAAQQLAIPRHGQASDEMNSGKVWFVLSQCLCLPCVAFGRRRAVVASVGPCNDSMGAWIVSENATKVAHELREPAHRFHAAGRVGHNRGVVGQSRVGEAPVAFAVRMEGFGIHTVMYDFDRHIDPFRDLFALEFCGSQDQVGGLGIQYERKVAA